jgi:hypothetical protein
MPSAGAGRGVSWFLHMLKRMALLVPAARIPECEIYYTLTTSWSCSLPGAARLLLACHLGRWRVGTHIRLDVAQPAITITSIKR